MSAGEDPPIHGMIDMPGTASSGLLVAVGREVQTPKCGSAACERRQDFRACRPLGGPLCRSRLHSAIGFADEPCI